MSTLSPPEGSVGARTSVWPHKLIAGIGLAAAVALMVVAYLSAGASPGPDGARRPRGSALWIAHVSDPHFFEEPGKRATWVSDEREDQDAFADAVDFLRAIPGAGGQLPDALVITGDFGVDSTFLAARPAGLRTDLRRQAAVTAALLARSPIEHVFLAVGNNDLSGERADPAALGYFNRFVDSVRAHLAGTGVQVHNLTACYVPGNREPCAVDFPEDRPRVRFVGLASGSFKNGDRREGYVVDTVRWGRQDTTLWADSVFPGLPRIDAVARGVRAQKYFGADDAIISRFDSLLATAARDGRRAIVVTHEPDIEDPYLVKTVRDYQADTTARTRTKRQVLAGVWNVDSAAAAHWARAVDRPEVLAVLAGHLHSDQRGDYLPRYAVPFGGARGGRPRLFVGPPLAIKNQNDAPQQARGLSLYYVTGDTIEREIAWLDRLRGFALDSASRTAPLAAAAAGLAGADRVGVVVIGFLAAVIGVMMAFSAYLGEWRRRDEDSDQGLWWLQHMSFAPVLAAAAGGLVLALVLFCNTWTDRRAVALWFPAAFAVAAITTGAFVRLTQSRSEQ